LFVKPITHLGRVRGVTCIEPNVNSPYFGNWHKLPVGASRHDRSSSKADSLGRLAYVSGASGSVRQCSIRCP